MQQSPRNIHITDLMRYRFPLTAIASIFHRISGFLMILFIPFLLWVLKQSLQSPQHFEAVKHGFHSPIALFFIWVFLSALAYHLVAGIKHLLMDLGFFESLQGGKVASMVVMLLSLILIVALGVWLW